MTIAKLIQLIPKVITSLAHTHAGSQPSCRDDGRNEMEGEFMTAFILNVLFTMLIEESAKAGFRKLKKSKAIRRRISVLWFCLYIKWRSRK